jgi:glycerol kinase
LAPYWKENAKGTMVGLSFNTEKGHILRATLEAIAFRVKDVI